MKQYIYRNKGYLFLALSCSLIAALFGVRVQFLKGDVLDQALSRNIGTSASRGVLLGVCIVLELGFYYLYDLMKGKFIVESVKEVRKDFFHSLVKRSYPKFLETSQGEYAAKYTNEMEMVETQYFTTIPMLGEILIKILLVSSSIFILDYRIALITIFLITTPLYIPKLVERHLQRSQMEYVQAFERHLKSFTDWLKGFELIKNFSSEKKILELFDASNDLAMAKNLRKKQIGYSSRTLTAILSYFSHYIILICAAYLVIQGTFTAGSFFVSIGLIDQLSYPIISLSYFIQELIAVRPVNDSIMNLVRSPADEKREKGVILEDVGRITFADVGFSYEDKPILEGITMTFEKNNRYLLRGLSGSGKTTSMNLLLHYHDVDEGGISLDGHPVEEVENLNELIAIMRQDAIFFNDTLRNNLSMYQELPDDKLITILRDVGLEKFAHKEKLDHIIEEDGTNLSGGEKRRLALARVLLRQAPILILDEPLANLDEGNAASIEDLILSIEDRLVITISHQFSSSKLPRFKRIYSFDL